MIKFASLMITTQLEEEFLRNRVYEFDERDWAVLHFIRK